MNLDHTRVPAGYHTRRHGFLSSTVRLSAAATSYDPLVEHRAREDRRAEVAADAESDRLQAAVVEQLRAEQLRTVRQENGRKAWARHLNREDAPAPAHLDEQELAA